MDNDHAVPPASASIFCGTLRHTTTIGPRRTIGPPTTNSVRRAPPAPVTPPSTTLDAELTAILDAPLVLGETAMVGYARKEAELARVFAKLTILESLTLHKRLTIAKADDALVAKFMRLTVDRRTRLLNFLADARRREAVAARR
ncbi:MAG: hypothetical protein H0T89_01570 [Deltaproteobacteria bacterium]|nr:hypothetical protein [Deltaproteobacteria bacterium]MDQ3301264.1 hypothetical protein [Myxococcota bacterium]